VGIDASQGMIDAARKYESENLMFVLKDINDLNYSEKFDLVFSNATLHWVRDDKTLLKKVFRSLKFGGVLRFNFAADGNCIHFFKVIREAMAHPRYLKYFRKFEWPWFMPDVDTYNALVHQSLFREASVWGENADRFFPDTEAMIKWVDQPSIVPFLKHVEENDKTAFRQFVVERMVKETLQGDGRCFETFRRMNVFAKK